MVEEISISYKELLKNKYFLQSNEDNVTKSTTPESSSFFITTKAPMGLIKHQVETKFQVLSILGISPHSYAPCSLAESCSMEAYPHCSWCCSIQQIAGPVEHRYKVTLQGRVSDLEWIVFISELQETNEDEMDISSGRWPPEKMGPMSSCKSCEVRIDSVKNLLEFRMFT